MNNKCRNFTFQQPFFHHEANFPLFSLWTLLHILTYLYVRRGSICIYIIYKSNLCLLSFSNLNQNLYTERMCLFPYWVRKIYCMKNSIYSFCCIDRKSTRLNSSHVAISYAVFCLKKTMSYD